jgi:hypothetical protein
MEKMAENEQNSREEQIANCMQKNGKLNKPTSF